MEHTFSTPDPIQLDVELGAGTIRCRTDRVDASTVTVTGPRAEEFSVDLRGRTLAVVAPRNRVGFRGADDSHEVTVLVPTDSDLHVSTGSASLEASGRYDAVRVKSGSGRVEVEAAKGSAVVATGSGSVRCDSVGGDLRVKSGSGEVEVGTVAGSTAISTGSGDVALGIAGSDAVLKTGSGDAVVQRSSARLVLTTGSGDLQVTRAEGGTVQAKTASGDVRVGVPAGLPVWTDVSSTSGRIGSRLAPVGKPADGEQHLELRVRTVSGDIALDQV